MKLKKLISIIGITAISFALSACGSSSKDTTTATSSTTTAVSSTDGEISLEVADVFSERDLEQEADLADAQYIDLTSGEDITISGEGVYVLSGEATDVTVIIEATEDAKVQIVLDGITITNLDAPAIYVKTADKVFVTTTDSENSLEVTGTFTADGETNLDSVIFSKSDLTLNGVGTLEITSAAGNGITSKDDLKVTGGTYVISAETDGLEANDGIAIYDGSFSITSGKDGIHSENEDDTSLGYIYIAGGNFTINSGDDGIQGTTVVKIDSGSITIKAPTEGIEGTYIIFNGGTIDLYATDDGINATAKSSYYDVVIEVNGGDITVEVGSGDTDAFDANGSIYVNGGTINITAPTSSFDYDATAELNGGTVTVNGEVVTEIPESMMGGGPGGMRR